MMEKKLILLFLSLLFINCPAIKPEPVSDRSKRDAGDEKDCIDQDNDGSCKENDCDDNDPEIYPRNSENCTDGKDNNCNDLIDKEDPACQKDAKGCNQPQKIEEAKTKYKEKIQEGKKEHEGTCGGEHGREQVWEISLKKEGYISGKFKSQIFKPIIYLRKEDCEDGEEMFCTNETLFSSDLLKKGSYFLFIDSQDSSSVGRYELEVFVQPDICEEIPKDKVITKSEEYKGKIEGVQSFASGKGRFCTNAQGPENVWEIVLEDAKEIDISIGGDKFSPILYIRTQCKDQDSEIHCRKGIFNNRARLKTELDKGTYYLFVDSSAAREDPLTYTMEVEIQEPES